MVKKLVHSLPGPLLSTTIWALLGSIALPSASLAADLTLQTATHTKTMPRVMTSYRQHPFVYRQNRQEPIWANGVFPVENFQEFTSYFGYRDRVDGSPGEEFHYGLDMAAPEGSNVLNWWDGNIIEVSDGGSCGTSVVVESGEWTHRYCHLKGHVEIHDGQRYLIDQGGDIRLRQGEDVAAGERLGRVGMTGRTTGPHLHWALQHHGNWVDPLLVVRAMADGHYVMNSDI